MKNKDEETMQEIKRYLIGMLMQRYGYCGVAEGEKIVMLNSGESNLNIKMEITE